MLRSDRRIADAEVMLEADSADIMVLIVSQGFYPGPELRRLVLDLSGDLGEHIRVLPLAAIPRLADGSVDDSKVRASCQLPGAILQFEPPATETERRLTELVTGLLPDSQASMTDSVGILGGDSIIIAELAVLIAERFGVEIPPHLIFRASSLRELAGMIESAAVDSIR